MSAESIFMKLLRHLGFDANKRIDVVSLIFTLILIASFSSVASDIANKFWYLFIAAYYSFRFMFQLLYELIKNSRETFHYCEKVESELSSLTEDQLKLIFDIFKCFPKWTELNSGKISMHWVEHLERADIIESRYIPPRNDIEELNASMGAQLFELRVSRRTYFCLSKCSCKLAKQLGYKV